MFKLTIEDVSIVMDSDKITVSTSDETVIQNIHNKQVFSNDSGESVIELSGLASEDIRSDRSWAFAFYEQDGRSQPHYHSNRTENYYVLQGTAHVVVDDVNHDLQAGTAITIFPGQIHQVASIGEKPLQMIVKCTPAWVFEDQHFLPPPFAINRG